MAEKSQPEKAKVEAEVSARTAPFGEIVYQAIQAEGEHELERDSGGLAWSGLAAGLSMGFSMAAQALLRVHLPDAPWQPLVTKFGYTIGFLIVILGRQQLFTENTLTAILPLLKNRRASVLLNVTRLWLVVLLSNFAGGFVFAILVGHTSLFEPEVRAALSAVGKEAVEHGFATLLLRAIFAGWLIALMVWLLPFAEAGRVFVIIIISYVVGLGEFSHIVAGGLESFYLVVTGELSLWRCVTGFLIPTLIGNVIGGVSLVAALAHAQFMASGRGDNL